MAARKGQRLTPGRYPEGANRQWLQRAEKKAAARREKQAALDHKALVKELKEEVKEFAALAKSMSLDSLAIERWRPGQQEKAKAIASKRPPAFEPLAGHNPSRYAPFDFGGASQHGGGVWSAKPYGPNARTGETGYSLSAIGGGEASSASYVGFRYYSQSDAALYLHLTASVWGHAYAVAPGGYARSVCQLYLMADNLRSGEHFRTFQDIFNWGGWGGSGQSFGWHQRSVAMVIPMRRNSWYQFLGFAAQNALAGGQASAVSNFKFMMGPVYYSTI